MDEWNMIFMDDVMPEYYISDNEVYITHPVKGPKLLWRTFGALACSLIAMTITIKVFLPNRVECV